MICALRRSRLLLVTAVVALLGAIPMAALPLLHGSDDPACNLPPSHDSSAHHLSEGGARPADPQHCVVCHWSQWVRAIPANALFVSPSIDDDAVAIPCDAQPRTTTSFRSAARAPPLT